MTDLASFATERGPSLYPPRSKMLDMYSGDIARMLAEGRHENAEQAALTIPHVAVALADAGLQSSCSTYQQWCERWVQPDFGTAAYVDWCVRSKECEQGSGVPFSALRALRLQRRARELPTPPLGHDALNESRVPQAITLALLGAVCRWFEQEGRHDSIVQTNLARLGVLR